MTVDSPTVSLMPPRPADLRAEGLTLGYGAEPVVRAIDLSVPTGKITVIVGANGCGKSTLLRGLARLLPPASGRVLLGGREISSLPTRSVATMLALLPQQPVAPEGITVADLVGRGRHPHQGWLRQWSLVDDAVVREALQVTDTEELAARCIDELSGGQRQRVWIAMALAQQTGILLLDEPTTFLDVSHQLEVLDLLTERNRQAGTTVVMVLHDLNLAARYADHLVVLKEGRVLCSGAPAEVLDEATIEQAFGLRALVVPDPVCGSPMVVPRGRFHGAVPAEGVPLARGGL